MTCEEFGKLTSEHPTQCTSDDRVAAYEHYRSCKRCHDMVRASPCRPTSGVVGETIAVLDLTNPKVRKKIEAINRKHKDTTP